MATEEWLSLKENLLTFIYLNLIPNHPTYNQLLSRTFREKHWQKWNDLISANLESISFFRIKNPKNAYSWFHDALISANKQYFSPSSDPQKPCRKPKRWWNTFCREGIAAARKAHSMWKRYPSLVNIC